MFTRQNPVVASNSTVDRRTNPPIGPQKSVSSHAIGQPSSISRLPRLQLDENDTVFRNENSVPQSTNHLRSSSYQTLPINVQMTLSINKAQPITSQAPPSYRDSYTPPSLPVMAKVPPIGSQAPPSYAYATGNSMTPTKGNNSQTPNEPPAKLGDKSENCEFCRHFSTALVMCVVIEFTCKFSRMCVACASRFKNKMRFA